MPLVGEMVGGYRPSSNTQPPPLPLVWGLWWLVGGQNMLPAERATPVLLGQQGEVVIVQRGRDLLAPCGPVLDQFRVVGGRAGPNELVPDDRCPGELDQVTGAVTDPFTEHPVVVPEPVVLAEVAAFDPFLRLVRVLVDGPPPGEPPHV